MRATMAFVGRDEEFGYQALDTPDGRSSKAASALRMHRGYDMAVAGLRAPCRHSPRRSIVRKKRILPLGLPRVDYLLSSEFEDEQRARQRAAVERLDIEGSMKGRSAVRSTLRRGWPEAMRGSIARRRS